LPKKQFGCFGTWVCIFVNFSVWEFYIFHLRCIDIRSSCRCV